MKRVPPWTPKEDAALKRLALRGFSNPAIARRLNARFHFGGNARNQQSVRSRAQYVVFGMPWTVRNAPLVSRFWAKVHRVAGRGCWEWIGAKAGGGYGTINIDGKKVPAHVVSYQLHVGPVPRGRDICHNCDNPPCVRPGHLFPGTKKQNMRDCARKGRHRHQTKPETILKGEKCGTSKFTEVVVKAVRARRNAGATLKELEAEFGMTYQNAAVIVNRKTWKHIP